MVVVQSMFKRKQQSRMKENDEDDDRSPNVVGGDMTTDTSFGTVNREETIPF
jgi:hypothetical protein